MSTLQPANVATPTTTVFGLAVQDSVAPPGVVSARVTEPEYDVSVPPKKSWTVTVGWEARAVPPVPLPGWAVNARWSATTTTTAALDALGAVQLRWTAVTAYV